MKLKKHILILFVIVFLSLEAFATKSVLFLGDSLTEGYGVGKSQAYPQIVKNLAQKKGKNIEIINGGVSGSTSASGLERLNWYLKKKKPDILVLALGANDGLRGFDLNKTKTNLLSIIQSAKKEKIKIVMAGMLMPPNYGKKYTNQFKKMYSEISKTEKIEMIPFLLKDVAGKKALNLPDGIHPNAQGHKVIGKTVYTFIKDLI